MLLPAHDEIWWARCERRLRDVPLGDREVVKLLKAIAEPAHAEGVTSFEQLTPAGLTAVQRSLDELGEHLGIGPQPR